jgi:hypothetical protein
MSFAVEPISVPYPVTVVAEVDATHHRRGHDEADPRRPHPHVETPSSEDSTAVPAEPESPSLVGRLIDVRA